MGFLDGWKQIQAFQLPLDSDSSDGRPPSPIEWEIVSAPEFVIPRIVCQTCIAARAFRLPSPALASDTHGCAGDTFLRPASFRRSVA